MTQSTSFGEASLVTYMEVKKASGEIKYYKVVDEQNIEIDHATYEAEAK